MGVGVGVTVLSGVTVVKEGSAGSVLKNSEYMKGASSGGMDATPDTGGWVAANAAVGVAVVAGVGVGVVAGVGVFVAVAATVVKVGAGYVTARFFDIASAYCGAAVIENSKTIPMLKSRTGDNCPHLFQATGIAAFHALFSDVQGYASLAKRKRVPGFYQFFSDYLLIVEECARTTAKVYDIQAVQLEREFAVLPGYARVFQDEAALWRTAKGQTA